MPTIFEPKGLPTDDRIGVKIATLANEAMLGTDALQVQRITLETNMKSEEFGVENAERFVYVVRGKGQALVGDQAFPLEAESVLWLEEGDAFHFEAGTDGLEVLLGRAPTDK